MTVPEATPDQVSASVRWTSDGESLIGWVEVRNVSDAPVRLSGKPGLTPLGADGRPLDTSTLVTMELRTPGYVDVPPGATARARVSWSGWDGPPAGGRVRVGLAGGTVDAEVDGPVQPPSRGPGTNLSSTWFELAGGTPA